MTPQERQLISNLFERLASLEQTPRDAEAERAILEAQARAPHAIYALVQTVLVQDEALRRAEGRIRELESNGAPEAGGGFLDSMRTALFGGRDSGQTSVPTVRPGASGPDPRWNNAAAAAPQPAQQFSQPGSSFLGTAAASAAGVIGGAMIYNMLHSMMSPHGQSHSFAGSDAASPWSNPSADSAAGSSLSRDAGLDDLNGGRHGDARQASLFDAGNDADDSDDGGDDGGMDFGDSSDA